LKKPTDLQWALNNIHKKWKPHEGQLKAGQSIFNDNKDLIFLRCGRKFGKTEFILYVMWRVAITNPNSEIYYICQDEEHGRKVLWENKRLEFFGPEDAIDSVNESKTMIRLKNDSIMRVIGSENIRASNGLTPHLLIYDEFAEFRRGFHVSMNPNRAVHKAPLVVIGTPPLMDSRNRDQYFQVQEQAKKKGFFLSLSSFENPHVDKEWLEEERNRLITEGEEYIWKSQYLAEDTVGGKNIIFPMFDKNKHVVGDKDMRRLVRSRKLDYYCLANINDTIKVAYLMIAIDKDTQELFVLDEHYVQTSINNSTQQCMPIVKKKAEEWRHSFSSEWNKIYNSVCPWFADEVTSKYNYFFMPSDNIYKKKEWRLSQLKDILSHDLIRISDKCQYTVRNIQNYVGKDDGRLPARNDDLICLFRFLLQHVFYSTEVAVKKRKLGPKRPSVDMFDGIQKFDDPWSEDDWTWITEE
jgi:hypothetical protein